MAVVVIRSGEGTPGGMLHRWSANEVVINWGKHLLDEEVRAQWLDPKWRKKLLDDLNGSIAEGYKHDGLVGLQAIWGGDRSLHSTGTAVDINL